MQSIKGNISSDAEWP